MNMLIGVLESDHLRMDSIWRHKRSFDRVTQPINPLIKDSHICVQIWREADITDSWSYWKKNNLKIFPNINSRSRKQHTSVHKAFFLGVCISKDLKVVSHAVYSTKFFCDSCAFLGQSPYRGESTSGAGHCLFQENDHPCKIKPSYSSTEACFEKGELSRKHWRQSSLLSVYILIPQPLNV